MAPHLLFEARCDPQKPTCLDEFYTFVFVRTRKHAICQQRGVYREIFRNPGDAYVDVTAPVGSTRLPHTRLNTNRAHLAA